MAALNYYIGAKRGSDLKENSLTVGTASAGTAVDVELNVQINNGSTATGITKKDVHKIICAILKYINSNGVSGSLGADLPPL